MKVGRYCAFFLLVASLAGLQQTYRFPSELAASSEVKARLEKGLLPQLERMRLCGQVQGQPHSLQALTPGRIWKLEVPLGAPVASEQIVLRLDPGLLQSQLEQQEKVCQLLLSKKKAANITPEQVAQQEKIVAELTVALQDSSNNSSAQSINERMQQAQAAVIRERGLLAAANPAVAEDEYAQAKLSRQEAQAQYDKFVNLYAEGAVSEAELNTQQVLLDEAQDRFEAAEEHYNAVTSGTSPALEAAVLEVKTLESELAQLKQSDAANPSREVVVAQLAEAKSELAKMQTALTPTEKISLEKELGAAQEKLRQSRSELEKYAIASASQGRLAKYLVAAGQTVKVGQPLAIIEDPDDLVLYVPVPRPLAALIKPGDRALVKVKGLSDYCDAEVETLLPAREPDQADKFWLHLRFFGSNSALTAGAEAEIVRAGLWQHEEDALPAGEPEGFGAKEEHGSDAVDL